mmetsp:Transcript_39102/g.74919  ORF Transcript_39102/g.74919 Transcript_39102/m.74919 type:complete len:221 (-) Transcript_39102:355-1017(-)
MTRSSSSRPPGCVSLAVSPGARASAGAWSPSATATSTATSSATSAARRSRSSLRASASRSRSSSSWSFSGPSGSLFSPPAAPWGVSHAGSSEGSAAAPGEVGAGKLVGAAASESSSSGSQRRGASLWPGFPGVARKVGSNPAANSAASSSHKWSSLAHDGEASNRSRTLASRRFPAPWIKHLTLPIVPSPPSIRRCITLGSRRFTRSSALFCIAAVCMWV